MKKIFALIAAATAAAAIIQSCTKAEANEPDEPEVYLVVAADANFMRFADQDSIGIYLDKSRDAGFNHILLDVKPIYGKVLYRSDYARATRPRLGLPADIYRRMS